MPTLDMTAETYKGLKKNEVLALVRKHKFLSVTDNDERFDLSILIGTNYGVKFGVVAVLTHLKKNKRHHSDVDNDDTYKIEYQGVMSPIDEMKVVETFKRLYTNTKKGKKTIIKPLTEKEKEEIILYFNSPIKE